VVTSCEAGTAKPPVKRIMTKRRERRKPQTHRFLPGDSAEERAGAVENLVSVVDEVAGWEGGKGHEDSDYDR
jgi:hypothetical protein